MLYNSYFTELFCLGTLDIEEFNSDDDVLEDIDLTSNDDAVNDDNNNDDVGDDVGNADADAADDVDNKLVGLATRDSTTAAVDGS